MGCRSCCKNKDIRKGLWSPLEDMKLKAYIMKHGHGCWSTVPKLAGLQRCGKSCRLRWLNYLRPGLKRGEFSPLEIKTIIQLQAAVGNRWALIAKKLPGRTDNDIKNFWNSRVNNRRLMENFFDPSNSCSRSFANEESTLPVFDSEDFSYEVAYGESENPFSVLSATDLLVNESSAAGDLSQKLPISTENVYSLGERALISATESWPFTPSLI